MLKDLKKGRAALDLQPKLEQRIELEKKRTELLSQEVATSDKIADVWRTTAEQQAKALAQKDAWWKSPYLWTAVGFVVGAATTVGISIAVKRSGAVE